MILSICICLGSFVMLIAMLRRSRVSFGLPVAYLFTLLFIHVPGAMAHVVAGELLEATDATEIGIYLTAIGVMCFVCGVWLARHGKEKLLVRPMPANRRKFAIICLVAGLGVTYTLRFVITAPSIGAVVEKAGGVWTLGVLLGLRIALSRARRRDIVLWFAAMGVYPVLTLLIGGFLSFGSTPVFIILCSLVVSTRNRWRVLIAVPLISFLFFTLFLSYMKNREDIRGVVWGGGEMDKRIASSLRIVWDFKPFNPTDLEQLRAIDARLNQNFFVGRAAQRIDSGVVNYLYGQSFKEGLMALVPRALWPSKPVTAGSPQIIMDMTGFIVYEGTSYGVGNVMEFHINFGIPSLVLGFLLLGLLLGWLDYHAALAEREGELGRTIIFFLPAAAIIHPNGSLVELTSGGAAAAIAAFGWYWLWIRLQGNTELSARGRRERLKS